MYRVGSEKYYEFFQEKRDEYNIGVYAPTGFDKQIMEGDLGKFDMYQGNHVPLDCPMVEEKDVELNKPKVGGLRSTMYVKDPKTGNVKKVTFGDTTGLKVKLDDKETRKSFAARHDCENQKDKTNRILELQSSKICQTTWVEWGRQFLLVKPYDDQRHEDTILRTFSEDLNEEELIWHRDKRTREVSLIAGEGWKLQMDNKLPEELKKGKLYTIPKMEYHRLIKGTGQLVLKIWEKNDD